MNIPKFRAWLKDVGLMKNVVSINFEDKEVYFGEIDEIGDDPLFDLDDVILMQSTGLTDKNGTLVFEGDIVRITFGDQRTKHDVFTHIATVEKVGLDWLAVRANTPHHHSRLNAYHNASFEVLGSVHANKELLNDN